MLYTSLMVSINNNKVCKGRTVNTYITKYNIISSRHISLWYSYLSENIDTYKCYLRHNDELNVFFISVKPFNYVDYLNSL